MSDEWFCSSCGEKIADSEEEAKSVDACPNCGGKRASQSSPIEKQIDDTTVILLYLLSFFIPLAGFIVGAIYASRDEEHYKHVGKNCLICSTLNVVLSFIVIMSII